MKTKKPLDSVGWLGGSDDRLVINGAARREAAMKPWSKRIPAAIADAWLRLDGDEYVLIPPHTGGNETKLTLVLTVVEHALAKLGWEMWVEYCESLENEEPGDEPPPALRAFAEKMEALSHD